jgi:2-oxoglutarate dehydrogenase E2 component (dihydrolipoamide succinyltransferase)
VEADEPLLEVSTDKVDAEIPSPSAGVLTKIVVREDETVEVGSELAVIDSDGAGSPEPLCRSWSPRAERSTAGARAAAPDRQPEPAEPTTENSPPPSSHTTRR